MAVFVELTTDAFQNTFNQEKQAALQAQQSGAANVRRPTRGLEIREDTYAILKVVDASGREIPLIDSGQTSGFNTSFTNFILQSVEEQRMEKRQIVETFGDSYIFFFGESPRFINVQAVLVDSPDFNWFQEFWANYDQYLRGTKCVEIGARVYLFYEDTIVEGYMLSTSASKNSQQPLMVNMQFQMFITNESTISFVGDPNFPVPPTYTLPAGNSNTNANVPTNQAQNATQGAQQQQNGFGGGNNLVSALQQGASPGDVPPNLQQAVNNAAASQGSTNGRMPSGLVRDNPVRGLISDNTDEFTGTPAPIDMGEIDADPSASNDPNLEAQDLPSQAMQAMDSTGAMTSNPYTMNELGLGPNFSMPGVGMGLGSVSSIGASFGPSFNASFGATASTGIGIGTAAGLGFASGTGASLGFGSTTGFRSGVGSSFGAGSGVGIGAGPGSFAGQAQFTNTLADQQNAASYGNLLGTLDQNLNNALGPSTSYANGVRVSGGITSGTGVAGGVRGGLPPTILFTANPLPSGVIGGTGNGANVNVGGLPSCFAMASTGGTLTSFDPQNSSFLS